MPNLIDIKNYKHQSQLKVINKGETVAEVLLYGDIGDSWFGDSITAKQFNEEIKKLPASVKEIHLRVNSPGGSVFEGMSIYEKIKAERKNGRKVIAYVDGLAASIASVIIQAADEVVVGDGAMVMIHKPMVGVFGNVFELERSIAILDKIEEQMISIYCNKTGLSRVEVSKALAEETWYTSDEAVTSGLADKKIAAHETLQLAACMIEDCKWMRNKPKVQNKNDMIREKLRDFNAKAKDYLKK